MTIEVNGVMLTDEVVSYLETILWAETVLLPVPEEEVVDGCMLVDDDHPLYGVRECEPLDKYFDLEDFSVESLRKACGDCVAFFDRLDEEDLAERACDFTNDETIAHDFWLTRNGHGAGFWDGDYRDSEDDIGDALSNIAGEFGECWVIVGEDGKLHIEG